MEENDICKFFKRVEEFKELKKGWYGPYYGEDVGEPLSSEGINWFLNKMEKYWELDWPYIYPTIEGNLYLEFEIPSDDRGTNECIIEINLKDKTAELLFFNLYPDGSYTNWDEDIFNLNEDSEWERLIKFF